MGHKNVGADLCVRPYVLVPLLLRVCPCCSMTALPLYVRPALAGDHIGSPLPRHPCVHSHTISGAAPGDAIRRTRREPTQTSPTLSQSVYRTFGVSANTTTANDRTLHPSSR